MARGYLPDARRETKRAVKHRKTAAKSGLDSIADRYNSDKHYEGQVERQDVPCNTFVERDAFYERRKTGQLPIYKCRRSRNRASPLEF